MSQDDIVSGRILEETGITLAEACVLCAIDEQWLARRVEEGLLPVVGSVPAEWRFSSTMIARARRMHEIERDFDAVPELAALVADLLEELDALRSRLRRAGLE